jgi:hypothetical protein
MAERREFRSPARCRTVVVYHGAATWRVSRQFADEVEEAPALRAYVPACVYHLIDLSGYQDDELRGAVMLHTALLTLKYIFRDELRERLPEILDCCGT